MITITKISVYSKKLSKNIEVIKTNINISSYPQLEQYRKADVIVYSTKHKQEILITYETKEKVPESTIHINDIINGANDSDRDNEQDI